MTMMGKNAVPPTDSDDLFSFKILYNQLVHGGSDHVENSTTGTSPRPSGGALRTTSSGVIFTNTTS